MTGSARVEVRLAQITEQALAQGKKQVGSYLREQNK